MLIENDILEDGQCKSASCFVRSRQWFKPRRGLWFFSALYRCAESKLWKHIFTPRNYFMVKKLSARGRTVLPTNSGGFDLNELRVVCCIYGTNVTHLAFTLSVQNEQLGVWKYTYSLNVELDENITLMSKYEATASSRLRLR